MRREQLGQLIRAKRLFEGLTLGEAALQSGVSAATLSRLERQTTGFGRRVRVPSTSTLAALSEWLGVSVDDLVKSQAGESARLIDEPGKAIPDIVEAHLRADRNLDPETAAVLSRTFRAAYEQFALEGRDTRKPRKDMRDLD